MKENNWKRAGTLISTGFCLSVLAGCGIPTSTSARGTSSQGKQSQMVSGLQAWNHKGNIALLYNSHVDNSSGRKLYTIVNGLNGEQSAKYFILDNVESAQFSPDGKWLAVRNQSVTNADGNQSPSETLWLISSDGKQRQKIATNHYTPGAWLGNQNIYVYGENAVYTVKPLESPVRTSISIPENGSISQFSTSSNTDEVAINETLTSGQNKSSRYDEIIIWNSKTGQIHPLVTANVPDGFILGPWINAETLYYWLDPVHSASLLADGAVLKSISLNGKTHKIATTLIQNSIASFGLNNAAIQLGGNRSLFTSKSVAIWNGDILQDIPQGKDTVAFWPASDPKGSQVAYESAPRLHTNAPTEQTQSWWHKIQLKTYDLQTKQSKTLTGAGTGVLYPRFDATGDAIVYIQGNSLCWISSDGNGTSHKVYTFPGQAWYSYPQDGAPSSLQIADYHP